MDGHGDLDETAAAGFVHAVLVRVVGHAVEARHELLELGEEVIERGLGGGEGVQELVHGDVWAGSEVTEYALSFG